MRTKDELRKAIYKIITPAQGRALVEMGVIFTKQEDEIRQNVALYNACKALSEALQRNCEAFCPYYMDGFDKTDCPGGGPFIRCVADRSMCWQKFFLSGDLHIHEWQIADFADDVAEYNNAKKEEAPHVSND
jgi:hypothetical protein